MIRNDFYLPKYLIDIAQERIPISDKRIDEILNKIINV